MPYNYNCIIICIAHVTIYFKLTMRIPGTICSAYILKGSTLGSQLSMW